MEKAIEIGVSGDEGSFSEEAALQYARSTRLTPQILYLTDMERVLTAVEAGTITLGIFPVANQRGGLVKAALKAMGNHPFTPVDDFWMDVHQCLLVRPGVTLAHVHKIVSHPQALAQCPLYLQSNLPNAARVEWEDTAKAAADLASGKLTAESAVIAPKRAAQLHGLQVLAEDIQDLKPNLTAFVVVKRKAAP